MRRLCLTWPVLDVMKNTFVVSITSKGKKKKNDSNEIRVGIKGLEDSR